MVQFGGDDQRGGRPARARAARRPRGAASTPRTSRSSTTPPRSTSCGGPRGRPRRHRARRRTSPRPGRAGRTPRSRPTGSATTCATCAGSTTSSATPATPVPPLRPLRPGLRAHPHPVRPAHQPRASRDLPARSWSAPPTSCVSYGGSLSGEHGDGQSRGELLPQDVRRSEVVDLFGQVKALFDPDDRMNPGKVVRPGPRWTSTCGWAPTGRHAEPLTLYFAYPEDDAPLRPGRELRCVGVGKLPAAHHERRAGDVPVVHGHPARRSTPPAAAPGCCSRWSTGTATADHRRLALDRGPRRARPVPGLQGLQVRLPGQRRHGHLQGRVPRPPLPPAGCGRAPTTRWAGCPCGRAAREPRAARRAVNALAAVTPLRRLGVAAGGGLEDRDAAARSPRESFSSGGQRQRPDEPRPGDRAAPVLLWPDTFTNDFHPEVGAGRGRVLEDAGLRGAGARPSRCAAG